MVLRIVQISLSFIFKKYKTQLFASAESIAFDKRLVLFTSGILKKKKNIYS